MEQKRETGGPGLQPVQFAGTAPEYFKIWVVNVCLTIVTLGIYSAWAKVRTLRYFYGNTMVAGHAFAYLADPIKILKGRVIAVGLLVIYALTSQLYPTIAIWMLGIIVLLIPFVITASSAFKMRNSAYRNIRFTFRRDIKEAYRIFLFPLGIAFAGAASIYVLMDSTLTAMEQLEGSETVRADVLLGLIVFAFLPVLPWLDHIRARFVVSHTGFGQMGAIFSAKVGQFYAIYAVAFAMFIGILVLMGFSIGGFAMVGPPAGEPSEPMLGPMVAIVIVFYAVLFFVTGYLQARRRNLIFNNTSFGQNSISSNLRALPLGWIYLSNTIVIILSLGVMIPWAAVRIARYIAESTQIELVGLESVVAEAQPDEAAFGEELGDAFDLDLGL